MDDDKALSILYDYIEHRMPEPPKHAPKCYYDSIMYSKWAAHEIYDRLLMESYILPETVSYIQKRTTSQIVDEFIDEMDTFAKISNTDISKFIFSVAGDEARRIKAYIC